MATYRPLTNPRNKAWLSGWDAARIGGKNPYKLRVQMHAWEEGRQAAMRHSETDMAQLKLRIAADATKRRKMLE